MHEVAICEALLDQVEREVRRAGERGAVRRVAVTVGALSGVSADALLLAFEVLAGVRFGGSPALDITKECGLLRCRACALERRADDPFGVCGGCGGRDLAVVGGDALTLDAIDVE